MKPSAIIFDLDGVLTDTAEFHYIAWKTIAEELGIEFTLEENINLKGVDRQASLQYIIELGNLTVGKQLFKDLLVSKNQHYLKLINDINPDHLFEGVLNCFTRLQSEGIKIGLASASKNAAQVISKLGIESYFDFVGDVASVAHSKPAPDIFLSVAKGLAVEPHTCIGVEDAIAGISAIKAANMLAIGIGDAEILTQADFVYPTMAQLDLTILTSYSTSQPSVA